MTERSGQCALEASDVRGASTSNPQIRIALAEISADHVRDASFPCMPGDIAVVQLSEEHFDRLIVTVADPHWVIDQVTAALPRSQYPSPVAAPGQAWPCVCVPGGATATRRSPG